MVTASYKRAFHIRFTPHYPHPFLCSFPHIPTKKGKGSSRRERKNYFMNFSFEIGFHAFLSFLLKMVKRSYRQQLHFSFISLIENEENGKRAFSNNRWDADGGWPSELLDKFWSKNLEIGSFTIYLLVTRSMHNRRRLNSYVWCGWMEDSIRRLRLEVKSRSPQRMERMFCSRA